MPKPRAAAGPRPSVDTTALAVVSLSAVVAATAAIGADARWLAAMGRAIFHARALPDGIPYADASSHAWPNVPVLGELVLYGLAALGGDRGLLAAQVAATAAALAVVAWDLRRGGGGRAAPLVLALVVVGSFQSLIAVRVQLFSLVLLPLTVALLRAEARAPSRRIWALVPLFALWSNLHGGVLVGLALAGAYLLLERARREPRIAVGVFLASLLAIGATPALFRTADYYHGVMENEAARRGVGLWAPLSLHAPLDVVTIAVAVPLLVLAVRSRLPRWELAALAGLALLTIQSGRGAVWLLLFAALPAARALRAEWLPTRVHAIVAAPTVVLLLLGLAHGPHPVQAGPALVDLTIARAGGSPILADAVPAEQLALAGARVWMANPLDAFPRPDQRLYLDWLAGRPSGDVALARAKVVLVMRGGAAERRLERRPAFHEVRRDAFAVLFVRNA